MPISNEGCKTQTIRKTMGEIKQTMGVKTVCQKDSLESKIQDTFKKV